MQLSNIATAIPSGHQVMLSKHVQLRIAATLPYITNSLHAQII